MYASFRNKYLPSPPSMPSPAPPSTTSVKQLLCFHCMKITRAIASITFHLIQPDENGTTHPSIARQRTHGSSNAYITG